MATRPRELSLFSGAGGGLLATKHLLGFKAVCYVEREPYCVEVIKARIRDGFLDDAPIWDDVTTFDGRPWRGCVDIVTAGFPCQPFSTASRGKKVAEDLWPMVERVVDQCRPAWVFAENVQAEPIGVAATGLEAMGYTPQCIPLSARDLGADHIRRRYWMAAHADNQGELLRPLDAEVAKLPGFCPRIWDTGPTQFRVADGVAHRMDRFRSTGNGQVPVVAAVAWRLLTQ